MAKRENVLAELDWGKVLGGLFTKTRLQRQSQVRRSSEISDRTEMQRRNLVGVIGMTEFSRKVFQKQGPRTRGRRSRIRGNMGRVSG